MPERIQLRRTKGWCMPPNTVSVARPTKWGNPLKVGAQHPETGGLCDADDVVEWYLGRLVCGRLRITEADVRRELAGKNLACWCPPGAPCHADVLLEIANQPEPEPRGAERARATGTKGDAHV